MSDYKNTLNLPRTTFSMKADLIHKEPQTIKFWLSNNIYEKMLQLNQDKEVFVLHDGPPYANGLIHIGHALNKIIKDIIIKYKTLEGFYTPFIPGWDCHGLPVEHQLFKELGKHKQEVDILDFRKKAKEFALKFVDLQKEDFVRLGVFASWDKPYLTLNPEYEYKVLLLLAQLVKKGYVYRGLKPVNWCMKCETALAEAEVEYYEKKSPSIYILFKVKNSSLKLIEESCFSVWTTTPWTLLGNVACAVHPQYNYVLVQINHSSNKLNLVILEDLLPSLIKKLNINKYQVIAKFKGEKLEGTVLQHPFLDRDSRVILADFVSREEGTGIVHIAPGHGQEDYIIGKKYNLPIIMPVDEKGRFYASLDFIPSVLKGMNVYEANPKIIEILRKKKSLLFEEEIVHSYPFCWRCKNPIIFRATFQIFVNVEHNNLRARLQEIINEVKWIPSVGKERILSMIIQRPDWCISRQRLWGVPIPAFTCRKCNFFILDPQIIEHIAQMVKKEGCDVYFKKDYTQLLPSGFKCPNCKSVDFKKETDILDVWFESGASFFSVVNSYPQLRFPSDLYVEGSDQHRGWFQVSLILSVAQLDKSPYNTVLTHGFVVDEESRKMSKSLGNVISPQEIIKRWGAEILRLWVFASSFYQDIKLSENIISQLIDAYRKIRNTFRFILGNLYDFSISQAVDYENMLELDRWILSKLYFLFEDAKRYYNNYQFHRVYQLVYKFCIEELSNLYFDILKDRLYTWGKNSLGRRSAQTALFYILKTLLFILAPALSFTSEEVFQNLRSLGLEDGESVFLKREFKLPDKFKNQELLDKYRKVFILRDEVMKKLEEKRQQGLIGSSLEAEVILKLPPDEIRFFKTIDTELKWIFITSSVKLISSLDREIQIQKAPGEKCQRCWNYSLSVGKDSRYKDVCSRCADILKGGD